MSTVIRQLRIEIARPVEGTWDELGTLLRTQRRIMAQLLRAGMDARIACGVVGAETAKASVAPKAAGASAGTVVYQAIKAALGKIQGGKWREECRPALDLPGGMLSALAQRVTQSYPKRPSFNSAQPVPIRKQEIRLAIVKDETAGASERVVLDVKLTSEGRTRLYARPAKGTHWHLLKQIARGEIPHGDCKLILDEHRRKWYALLAYERPIEERPLVDTSRALIVHRGIRNALTLMSTTGDVRYEPGAKLFAQLRQIEARMRDTRSISAATLGAGACGHGKARRYEHYDALANKRARVVHTFCQQMGAFVVRCAIEWGCGRIIIESYGGIGPDEAAAVRRALVRFPLHQLKAEIKNALQAGGFAEAEECSAEYISATCPACGNQDLRQHNSHTGTFHCRACELERPADFIAALHMLRRSGADCSLWDERMKKYERLRQALREPAE